MKQNYIMCLMGILTVYNVAFSMNKDPQEVVDFRNDYTKAEQLKKEGKNDEAIKFYSKVVSIKLPDKPIFVLTTDPYKFSLATDPYKEDRTNQTNAKAEIKTYVEKLPTPEAQLEKYTELAPFDFDDEIKKLKGEIATANIPKFTEYYSKAEEAEKTGDEKKAMEFYGKAADLTITTPGIKIQKSTKEKNQEKAKDKIKAYVEKLTTPEKQVEKYTELAPKAFADEIDALNREIFDKLTGPAATDLEDALGLAAKNDFARARDKATPYLKSSDEQVKNVAQSVLTQIDAKEQKTPGKPSIIQVQNGKAIIIPVQNLAQALNQLKLKIVSKS